MFIFLFFFNDTATTEIYTLSLHDALPIYLINGNSDLMIKTEKIGNNYNREVDRKRKTYYADQVDDKAILKILATIRGAVEPAKDRKSTRLNSSHANISYAVFCLKKKKTNQ